MFWLVVGIIVFVAAIVAGFVATKGWGMGLIGRLVSLALAVATTWGLISNLVYWLQLGRSVDFLGIIFFIAFFPLSGFLCGVFFASFTPHEPTYTISLSRDVEIMRLARRVDAPGSASHKEYMDVYSRKFKQWGNKDTKEVSHKEFVAFQNAYKAFCDAND
jgi:hypothetical protein